MNAVSSSGGTTGNLESRDLSAFGGSNVEFNTPYTKLCDPQAFKEKNELVSYACVNHPHNFKLKRLNDKIKKAIWTTAQNYKASGGGGGNGVN